MLQKIIENTDSAQKEFRREADIVGGGGCARNVITLSREELAALQQGGCVAYDDGEYSTFIVLDAVASQNTTAE